MQKNNTSPSNNVKITVVGDGIVGKTCLLSAYVNNHFPEEYVPTVFEHYGQIITVDGQEYNMTLWDTAGQEDYERLRPLSYPNTNCFLVCFSVEKNSASYDNVYLKWVPEVRHHRPHTPIVLVATKIDLRDDPSTLCYTTEEGKKLKKKIRAQSFMECSALQMKGLDELFTEAIKIHKHNTVKPKRKTQQCQIL